MGKNFLKKNSLIFADEPAAAIDSINADEVMNLLFFLKSENNIIIVVIDDSTIWRTTDVVIPMEDF